MTPTDPGDAHALADATFGGCGRPDCPTGHLEPDPGWPLVAAPGDRARSLPLLGGEPSDPTDA